MQSLWSNRGGGQGLLAGIAVIFIAVGAYFIFKGAKSGDQGVGDVYYYCTNCQKEFTANSSETPPIKCPFCKQPTGVLSAKSKCEVCGKEFISYLQKYDPETKVAIERRKRGDSVPDTEIHSIMVTEPDTDDWIDAGTPEGLDVMTNVVCPEGCEGEVTRIFPKVK
ncbi:zinc ribbon domain-containing protein [bacterium]|nr:zinc ribbon domain-containing protein [bacterium]